jgi:threonylcarbamoyladenosine tRNA methylthiotransferase MtaB
MIFIKTYGCSENRFWAKLLALRLLKKRYGVYLQRSGSDKELFRDGKDAFAGENASDVIFFTCSLTRYQEDLICGHVALLKKVNPRCSVRLMGCSLSARALRGVSRWIVGTDRSVVSKERFFGALDDVCLRRFGGPLRSTYAAVLGDTGTVLVKSGCSCRCSYCVCPRLKPAYNVPLDFVNKQLSLWQDLRVGDIEFAGPCPSGWRDPVRKADLGFLVGLILENYDFNIVNLEFYPSDITPGLLELLRSPKVHKFISVPIQSASDVTLRRMGRLYRGADLRRLFGAFFKVLPAARVTTDIIVGYPGETAASFEQTVRFLKMFPWARIDVYTHCSFRALFSIGSKQSEVHRVRIEKLKRQRSLRGILNMTNRAFD